MGTFQSKETTTTNPSSSASFESLENWTSVDVALALNNMGKAYSVYAETVLLQNINGTKLTNLLFLQRSSRMNCNDEGNESMLNEALENWGVSSRLHRMVLEKKLRKLMKMNLIRKHQQELLEEDESNQSSWKSLPQILEEDDEEDDDQEKEAKTKRKKKINSTTNDKQDREEWRQKILAEAQAESAKERLENETLLAYQAILKERVDELLSLNSSSSSLSYHDSGYHPMSHHYYNQQTTKPQLPKAA